MNVLVNNNITSKSHGPSSHSSNSMAHGENVLGCGLRLCMWEGPKQWKLNQVRKDDQRGFWQNKIANLGGGDE